MPVVDANMGRRIEATFARLGDKQATANELGLSRTQVYRYIKNNTASNKTTAPFPDSIIETGDSSFPDPVKTLYDPVIVNTPGKWLILGDVHIPYQDKRTCVAAVEEARNIGAVGVLLNGDILDTGEVSSHERNPDEPRLEQEFDMGRQFMRWLRSRLPNAKVIYRQGNHEARLPRYLARCCPTFFGNKNLTIPKLLDLDGFGVEWVQDKRVIMLGKLATIHGHEYRGGGGVNPARWLFLRTLSTALTSHFHRISSNHERGLDRRVHGTWSIGCACHLSPSYDPLNKWSNGYCIVDVKPDGGFVVANREVFQDGRVA